MLGAEEESVVPPRSLFFVFFSFFVSPLFFRDLSFSFLFFFALQ